MAREKNDSNNGGSGIKLIPQSVPLAILMLVTLLVEAAFMLLLAGLDVLPVKYAVIVLIVLIALTVLIIKLLNCRKPKTIQRKLGVILSAVLMAVLIFGMYYLYTTYNMLSKISDEDVQTEDFHVVVLEDGSYDKVEDIEGQDVYITSTETDAYTEAKEKLQDKVAVTYKEAKSSDEEESEAAETDQNGEEGDTEEAVAPLGNNYDTGYMLYNKQKEASDNIIFVSNGTYDILCEDIKGFKKATKIIYTISVEVKTDDIAKRINVTEDPYNIYISGIDTYGGIEKVARSDVNMIMTVNPKTKEILLTSIPRDMYVTLHTYGAKDKLTHTGIYGINETVNTVEDWLDIDINYYIRVNFTTLEDVVDAIGGIDVESDVAFSSAVSDYSYVQGTNHLDGEAALYFARERKAFKGGDNERVKNQQRVLSAILKKMTNSTALLTGYSQIMDSVGGEIQTNLKDSDMEALVKMQLSDMSSWDTETISIEGDGTYASTFSMGSQQLYVMIPDEDSVLDAQKEINKVMGITEEEQEEKAEQEEQ